MRLADERWGYTTGLHDIGSGAYAWLAPDGSWGWSNAGLITDGDESLVVDTLFDLALTSEMLAAMRDAEPVATATIDRLVNTHANGDHCHGNELVAAHEIIASTTSAAEMSELPPEALAALMDAFATGESTLARYLRSCFASFDFHGISLTLPTRTFEQHLEITVGDKTVGLYEVGPAHTGGDVIVHCPSDGTVFTGDILFIEGSPIMWAGPVQNWLDACDLIVDLDADVIVPGHGPITDERGVTAVREYLGYVRDEARTRYEAGMSVVDAARDIDLGHFGTWTDTERIVANVAGLYREFGSRERFDTVELFQAMAEYAENVS
ncbi:MAG: MBL fold metallo-hydrolase [Acidimicrobiia bacterium]|nr:MBL fold metallo-hydrolase [Acidimicrobiia bacterium]